MSNCAIPTVDLSVFFQNGDEEGKKAAKAIISRACSEYGFFQAVNHGVSLELMSRAMELTKTFFTLPEEEKIKYRPRSGAPVPAGYGKQPAHSSDKNEYLLMLPPQSSFNVLPNDPPGFREVLEEMFKNFSKTGEVVESILNDCLGLPPNFLKEYNDDRTGDLMSAKRYFPATETENIGISEHEDSNCITFIFQDEVGGLEVLKHGEWIPVVPVKGTIVVNVADVIQVLTNNKFKSSTHRVIRSKGRSRHSFSFFYNLQGDKIVEPLPNFTEHIGEPPKYRQFVYKSYQALRIRNKTHPPNRPVDVINISHYAISPHNNQVYSS
ncbi:flavonol synthase/flavanone 3-hydroxylase-like isoform X2 [Olea europaea var. sylvestris]|nr:flavonol synthase/flavanone 3-hydroxylase-like isoform X2 [Olea europaea var. sylvestris]